MTGPIDGARPPTGAPGSAVAEAGYVVEEYRIEGTAAAYATVDGQSPDPTGHWQATVVDQAEFLTRILVIRPADPHRFNGTVVLNWQNVSAGTEQPAPRRGELYRGYAWVGVSAQEVGIYGWPAGMHSRSGGWAPALPLADADPERYSVLNHPGDQGSFDIFSAAARAVGAQRSSATVGVDPLDGLDVHQVLAAGGSQSAMRLAAYINGIHPTARCVDGFLLALWEGRAPGLLDGPVGFGRRTAIRADTDVPVMIVNSEFEVPPVQEAGVVDGDHQRVWEVAGTPHAPSRGGQPGVNGSWGSNPLSIHPIHEAALRGLHRWAGGGPPPGSQPRVEVDPGIQGKVVRDRFGNAIGGIRLPQVAAPVAEYRGMSFGTGRPPLFGAARRFDDGLLQAIYPTRAGYLRRWNETVDHLLASGALLEEDAGELRAAGSEVELPL